MKVKQGNFLQANSVRFDGKTFVQRYTICGKPNCWCHGQGLHPRTKAPGHGPYWYRVLVVKGKVMHKYKGKELVKDDITEE